MQSTSRNQWTGKVIHVLMGAITAEIEIALDAGPSIIAAITVDSAKALGLESGREVLAMVKAPMIMLAIDFEGYAVSARNQMNGVIVAIKESPVSADVTLDLETGGSVTASLTEASCLRLGLSIGQAATALFNPESVILAAKKSS
jgi:molybdate transport system regulatory protein